MANETEKKSWPGSDLPKYCIKVQVEIRKEPEFVKDVVFKKFGSISDWHPDVEKVEFDDNDPVQIGSVRKLVFYPGGGNPEYVFQEIVDLTDDAMVTRIQEENRPSILSYMGPTFRITAIDKNTTSLEVADFYATKLSAVTSVLAKTMLKTQLTEHVEKVCRGIKLHCETGEVITDKTDLPSPHRFKTVTNVYDIFEGDASDPKRTNDPFDGIERFCCIHSREIRAPVEEVREIMLNLDTCPMWHVFVEHTERKGANTFNGPGAVRMCGFYKELVEKGFSPTFLWEEMMDVSDDHLISLIQEENRPAMVAYAGHLFKFEAIDKECTRITTAVVYRPSMMPMTKFLATGMMKEDSDHKAYLLTLGIKNYVETKNVSKYSDMPENPQFKEGVIDTLSVFE